MSSRFFSPIVEGHGEIAALPLLIRRICAEFSPEVIPTINPPIRILKRRRVFPEVYPNGRRQGRPE
jgi:hypothetical protein